MINFYNTKNPGKYKKEMTYPDLKNLKDLKDYFFKLSLTNDNKLLFRCYNLNSLDCTCYEVVKTVDEIFNSFDEMKMYENGSVLFNVLKKKYIRGPIINYDKKSDTISIETNDNESNIKFELHRESITCIKEYILLLCQTIKQFKKDSEYINKKKEDINSGLINAKKIPSILNDIENLKSEIKSINKILAEKEIEINSLKKERILNSKLTAKNTAEINELKNENENLKIRISDNQEDFEKINEKISENSTKIKNIALNMLNRKYNQEEIEKIKEKLSENSTKMQNITLTMFNRRYRTNIGNYLIKNINLEGRLLGNIALKDLCNIEFNNLERLNLSSNYLSDITYLKNAKFSKLKELDLFFNNIKDISSLDKVKFTSLTKLGLSDNFITDIKVLKNVKFPILEKLALSNNIIKDIKILGEVDFRFLRELKLSKNGISDISILKKANFTKLKSLMLSNNDIENIDALCQAKFPILLELKLSNNNIRDIRKLSEAIFKWSLKRLYLSNNKISVICSFDNFKDLKELYISNNFINRYNLYEKYQNKFKVFI